MSEHKWVINPKGSKMPRMCRVCFAFEVPATVGTACHAGETPDNTKGLKDGQSQ